MKNKDKNNRPTSINFKSYVIALLNALAKSEKKDFYPEFTTKDLITDGYIPNGLKNIEGPLAVKIKYRKLRIFDIELIADSFFSKLYIKKLLIIVNEKFEKKKFDNTRIVIWDKYDIIELAERFPEVKFQFSDEYIPGLLEYTENKSNTKKLANDTVEKYETKQFNENKENYIKQLKKGFKEDDLVLFLGSGVSQQEGLPGWKKLIGRLITDFLKTDHGKKFNSLDLDSYDEFKSFSYITLGRFIKKALKSEFYDKLNKVLYKEYESNKTSESVLNNIADLCMPIRGKIGVHSIVTYNYDDILESNLDKRSIKHTVIYQKHDAPSHSTLPLYHVHGYIPKNRYLTDEMKDSIVFAEEEYHFQYKEPYSWQNLIQLNLLKEKTGLFIGLSMNDPNLRRLLDIAKGYSNDSKHYAILGDHWKFDNEKISNIFRSMEEDVFNELGINVIWYKDISEINGLINEISKN